MSINLVVLDGTVQDVPKFFDIKGGESIGCNFTLVSMEKYQVAGEEKTSNRYHRISCFGGAAEIAKDFKNGDLVYLNGSLCYSSYEKDGVKVTAAYVNAYRLILLNKSDATNIELVKQQYKENKNNKDIKDVKKNNDFLDDIPF